MIDKNSLRKIGCRMLCAALLLNLTGCAEKEMPSDTPWNNGFNAIMETDTGYYSNSAGHQCLRYYEKDTGTEIYLCAKPECRHGGEKSCIGTYNDLATINSVLYDGAIYTYVLDVSGTSVKYSLYKAAADGSAMDKVGDAYTAENPSRSKCFYYPSGGTHDGWLQTFIIHKGYAYLPFYLALKYSEKGFVDGGIIKMDLKTGKTEQIYSMAFLSSPLPCNLRGCGDYVYYDLDNQSKNGNIGGKGEGIGTFRYDIRDGSRSCPFPDLARGEYRFVSAVSEDRLYVIASLTDDDDVPGLTDRYTPAGRPRRAVFAYDSATGEKLGVVCVPDTGDDSGFQMTYYNDRLFLYTQDRTLIYDKDGEKLGEIGYDFPGTDREYTYDGSFCGARKDLRFMISHERLYAICQVITPENTTVLWKIYSCPIEDITGGGGEWTYAYEIKSWWSLRSRMFSYTEWVLHTLTLQ